ncbi:hypothetical protein BURPS1655_B0016 [Burkholderia pseudomallei 1655]|nr:hypothetical protein BURPS1655_B0016 [Burkholderia pseudomallei 1655]
MFGSIDITRMHTFERTAAKEAQIDGESTLVPPQLRMPSIKSMRINPTR